MPVQAFKRLMKGEPINLEERLENLEKITDLKLRQFEDTLLLFRDVVMRLYEEKEELRKENEGLKASLADKIAENASSLKEAARATAEKVASPIKETADDFLELVFDQQQDEPKPAQLPAAAKASHISPELLRPSDEMERTIKWMREKFGLPPHQLTKKRKKAQAAG